MIIVYFFKLIWVNKDRLKTCHRQNTYLAKTSLTIDSFHLIFEDRISIFPEINRSLYKIVCKESIKQ